MSFVAWQRARLARLGSAPRRRRSYLWAAALLGGLFAATVASWLTRISGDADLGGTAVLVHNAVGLTALAGCLGCLMAALRPATTDVS